ncbi:hypothetical protein BAJUN_03150 [Bajunvirus bajun]|uniref:Uncharacterized protein n=1 Tax=Brevundimonas phage vB_BgoS-Bajun TaxID=2948594 RepID=A0A9E7SUZ0_9CAUD|nr:hypothetical protein BAJUN_03150 [Brevundimonas phage vB_BgoS-Bajun]
MLQGTAYENLFRYAADDVSRQTQHPGQSVPGLWNIEPTRTPETIIVAIVAAALARVAIEHKVPFQPLLHRYVEMAPKVPFRAVGAPDSVAIAHLKDMSRYAAEQRSHERAEARLAQADRRA